MFYRLLIGDDHQHARVAIRMIIENDSSFKIVGEAKNGKEILDLAAKHQPDLILMDINMSYINGLQATEMIKAQFPQIKIVIVTVSDDVSDLFTALKQGAQGYLLKNLNSTIWLEYLHAIMQDHAPIPREIAQRILTELKTSPNSTSLQTENSLTTREQEILTHVAKGWSNKEIATKLMISQHTVKNHLKNIMQKLHVKNRVQLTRYVYEQNEIHNEKL